MAVHCGLQLGYTTDHLRERGLVAPGQLLHALGELLAHAVRLWSSPGFPDGLVRLGKGGFMLGRTSLAESGVPPLPIVEDLDVLKEIRPRRGP